MSSYGSDIFATHIKCDDVSCEKVGSATCDVKAASVDASGAVSAASVAATGAVTADSVDVSTCTATTVNADDVSASAHLNVGILSGGPGATTPASGSAGDLWVIYGNDGTTYEESSNGLYVHDGAEWIQAAQMNGGK